MQLSHKRSVTKLLIILIILYNFFIVFSSEYVQSRDDDKQFNSSTQIEKSLTDNHITKNNHVLKYVSTEDDQFKNDIIVDDVIKDDEYKNDVIVDDIIKDDQFKNDVITPEIGENDTNNNTENSVESTEKKIGEDKGLESITAEALLKSLDSETLLKIIDTDALIEMMNDDITENNTVSANIKDFGAVGDGVTNDSKAFKKALNYINNKGGGVLYFSSGSYKLRGDFIIPAKCKIIGSGNSNILLGGTFNLYNPDCVIDGLRISVDYGSRVFRIVNSKNITIKNCYVDGRGWNGDTPLQTGASGCIWAENSKNIRIEHNEMFNFKDSKGMDFMNSRDIYIAKNKIHHTGRAGISLYRGNKNTQIMFNEISHAVKNFTVGDGAIDLYGPYNEDTTIEGNIISDFGCEKTRAQGIRIHGSKNTKIINNTISSSKYCFSLIIVQKSENVIDDGIIISGNLLNVLDQTHPAYLIRLDHGKNIRITTNIFKNLGTPNGDINCCISIRRNVQNCTISENITVDKKTGLFPSGGVIISASGNNYKKINIIGNIFETVDIPILISNLETGVISSNILKSIYSSSGGITVVKSNKIIVTGNMIEQPTPNISTINTKNVVEANNNFIKSKK